MTLLQSLHNLTPVTLTSLAFVYVYLPICMLARYAAPKRFCKAVLLAASIGFYAVSQPDFLLFIALSVSADYFLSQGVAATRRQLWRKMFLWICVIKNLFLIGYFGVLAQVRAQQTPLGLLIICVSGIDAALEIYRQKESQMVEFVDFILYVLFFPRLYAGPVMKMEDFFSELENSRIDGRKIMLGFGRFAEGAFKYAIIGYQLFMLYNSVKAIPADSASVLSAWVFVLSFALALYYTLSGFADMARGVAGLLGMDLPQNFYYPYQSRSVSDFFERFNITAGTFLKRAVQEPLNPSKKDIVADSSNILLVGMLWGIWFGMRVNYVVWGAFIALFIIMEKHLYPKAIKAVPTLFRRGYALCVALAGFTIFAGESLGQSLEYFIRMFSFASDTVPLFNSRVMYVLSFNWILLVAACVLATNLFSLLTGYMRKTRPHFSGFIFCVMDMCILAAFTAVTLGGGRL